MTTKIEYITTEGLTDWFSTSYPSFKILVRTKSGFDNDVIEKVIVLSDISHALKTQSIDEYVQEQINILYKTFKEDFDKYPEEVLLKEIPVI